MLELTLTDIQLGRKAANKQDAILSIANDLVQRHLVVAGYEQGMLNREAQNSTFLGNGIAIPHGTTDTRELVNETGVQIDHFAEGVDWGDGNTVYLAIGIAAKSDEHLGILKQLTKVLSADGVDEALKNAKTKEDILAILSGTHQGNLLFDESLITLASPATDLLSLVAISAGKLQAANAIDSSGVAALITKQPIHLGQGFWLLATHDGVQQTAISFITPQTAFLADGKQVQGVFVISAINAQHLAILSNISARLEQHQADELLVDSPQAFIELLTQQPKATTGLVRVMTIKNPHGLHARPGAVLVSVVKPFASKILVTNLNGDGKQVNAKSLMKVISMGVKQGHQLEFVADGEDAEQALDAIENAINTGLGEA